MTTLEDHYGWLKNGASGKPKPSKESLFDINQLTIEHIYPQKAKGKIQLLETHKNSLGNLTFWAPNDNRAAGNEVFDKKKELYKKSSIYMNRELTHIQEWNEQELKNREKKLVNMAIKLFKF